MTTETTQKLKSILQQFPLEQKEIDLATVNGPLKTKAVVSGTFAVHKAYDAKTYNITDLISGYSIVTGYDDIRAAILGVQLVLYTMGDLPNPFLGKNVTKNRKAKAIFKFLSKHRRVWNNVPLENQVGCFYRDRAECERLRHKINPKMPIEYLDEQAHDNKMISDLLMGNV